MKIVNVASKSSTTTLSELIISGIGEGLQLKAIGAAAVNQAVKSIAIAEQKLTHEILTKFAFFEVTIEDKPKSGILITLKKGEHKNG